MVLGTIYGVGKGYHLMKRERRLDGSEVRSFAAFSMSMIVRGLPVLPSTMVIMPVTPRANRTRAAS